MFTSLSFFHYLIVRLQCSCSAFLPWWVFCRSALCRRLLTSSRNFLFPLTHPLQSHSHSQMHSHSHIHTHKAAVRSAKGWYRQSVTFMWNSVYCMCTSQGASVLNKCVARLPQHSQHYLYSHQTKSSNVIKWPHFKGGSMHTGCNLTFWK